MAGFAIFTKDIQHSSTTVTKYKKTNNFHVLLKKTKNNNNYNLTLTIGKQYKMMMIGLK